MKPRTKLHVQVVELSNELYAISKEQKQWAFTHCLEHKGYANKSRAFCLDCGETFSLEFIKRKRAVCPHCQTKLVIDGTRKTTDKQVNYFAITEIVEDFQVVRNFKLYAYYKLGTPVKYFLQEILQYWVQPNGKKTMVGLNHNLNGYCDSWSGLMEIREEKRNYWHGKKYDVFPRKYHPESVFKKEYSKYGMDSNLSGINVVEAINILPKNPKAETLLKAKQYSLLGNYCNNHYNNSRYWDSVKICFRNKYKVKDSTMYFDYLDLLSYFKKDLHNAKYVCPANLKLEHNRLMNKKREIQRAEERERDRQRIIERQKRLEKAIVEYTERMQKFFELEFKKGNISITVLKSIDEFKEEGDELKHCVYTNEYYLREKSLILSARVDGKRAETIELKLPELKIEQSRGINNKSTEHHDKIIKLVKKNLEQIRKIVIQSRPRGRKKSAA